LSLDPQPSLKPSSRHDGPINKWLVSLSVLMGAFLSVMDANVVNLALPDMMTAFHVTLAQVTWVATVYTIGQIVAITMVGWSATLIGRKALFMWSMGLFILGSMLAGLSRNMPEIVLFRLIQGFGSGSLVPCSQAIISEVFPPAEQGTASAVYSAGVGVAPAIGPVIGGILMDRFGWPAIFFINVPVCLVGLLMVWRYVEDPRYLRRGLKGIDGIGIGLLAIGVGTVQLVVAEAGELGWFRSPLHLAASGLAATAVVSLVWWELRQPEPVVRVRLLHNRHLAAASILGTMTWLILYGSSFMIPQFCLSELGYDSYRTALVLLPRALLMLAVTPLAARLYNTSPRMVVALASVLEAWSCWLLAGRMLAPSFTTLVLAQLPMALGVGCIFVMLTASALNSVPAAEKTGAAGLYTLARREGSNLAYALFASIISFQTARRMGLLGDHRPLSAVHHVIGLAYRDAYMVGALAVVISLPLTWMLPSRADVTSASLTTATE
jgi:DHA2 family multidrug resistance protein